MSKVPSSSSNTAMTYDSFKPKFPLDPFATSNVSSTRLPWSVDVDTLPILSVLQSERRVILAIGQPTTSMLEPLLHSPQLTSSLLIIASHRPPPVPSTASPAVYTLRLRSPIAVEHTGAARLVDVLECAVQVAQLWRRTDGPHIQELAEEASKSSDSTKHGQSTERLRYSIVPTTSASASQNNRFSSTSSVASNASVFNRRQSSKPAKKRSRQSGSVPSPADLEQRPLDAILHFIPADIPDKAMLKAAILVTTLTRPYLSAAPMRVLATRFWSDGGKVPTSPSSPASGKRWSLFRSTGSAMSSSSTIDVDPRMDAHRLGFSEFHSLSDLSQDSSRTMVSPLARCRKSRVIHLMPSVAAKASYVRSKTTSAQARLIRSIEAFLLSFSFPLHTPASSSNDPDLARARPYLLPCSALAEVLQFSPASPTDSCEDGATQSEWTLAELVLSGALESDDAVADGYHRIHAGKQKAPETPGACEWMAHRAWVGSLSDILVRSKPREPEQAQTQMRVGEPPVPRFPQKAPLACIPEPLPEKSLPSPPPEESSPGPAPTKLPPDNGSSRPQPQRLPKSNQFPLPDRSVSAPQRNYQRVRASSSSPSPQLTRRPSRSRGLVSESHGLPTPPDSEKASPEDTSSALRTRDRERERERRRNWDRERVHERRRMRVRTGSDPHPSMSRNPSRRAKSKTMSMSADAISSMTRADVSEHKSTSLSVSVSATPPGERLERRQMLRHETRLVSIPPVEQAPERWVQAKPGARSSNNSPAVAMKRPEQSLATKQSKWKFWKAAS